MLKKNKGPNKKKKKKKGKGKGPKVYILPGKHENLKINQRPS